MHDELTDGARVVADNPRYDLRDGATLTEDPPASLSRRQPWPNWLRHLIGSASGAGRPAIGFKSSIVAPLAILA